MPKPSPRRRAESDEPKVSRQQKPDGMTLEEWQRLLRRQYGRSLAYEVRNIGGRPAFSDFLVDNPASDRSYRVTIRGSSPGDNTCSCPDFATNTLGTCKHVEFVLARLERSRTARAELKAGYHPDAGEVFLRYGSRREVCLVPPVDAHADYRKLSARFFGPDGRLLPAELPKFDEFLAAAVKYDPDLKVDPDVAGYLAEVRDAEARVARVAEAFPKGVRSPAFNNLLAVPLYDYQREGVLFAARAGR
ncbi:MAG: SWIM zinc finger family protein, partial [Planctomycetia bacterium]